MRRAPLAVTLPDLNQQRMVLVEECWVRGKVLVQEGLDFSIVRVRGYEFVPCQDASSISVGHEVGVASGINEDGVDCLRPEAL